MVNLGDVVQVWVSEIRNATKRDRPSLILAMDENRTPRVRSEILCWDGYWKRAWKLTYYNGGCIDVYRDYKCYIGRMEKKMETTGASLDMFSRALTRKPKQDYKVAHKEPV